MSRDATGCHGKSTDKRGVTLVDTLLYIKKNIFHTKSFIQCLEYYLTGLFKLAGKTPLGF